jgi:hypothetical protein
MSREKTTDFILRNRPKVSVSKDGRKQPKSAVADFGDLCAEVGQARLRMPCSHPSRRAHPSTSAQERAHQDEVGIFCDA